MPAVHTIDLQYLGTPGAVAAFLVAGERGEAMLIECGPASTLAALQAGLVSLGLDSSAIRHVLVTHIHLDHAGAAGQLARLGARIYVHERGAPHLVDPSRLIQSATRIYGGQMDRLWGSIVPVPAGRVSPVRDGDMLDLCGLQIRAIHTPGHAKHHLAFVTGESCFCGDAAGIIAPVPLRSGETCSFITVPTPPPEFDLEAWEASIDRLATLNVQELYLTHFGLQRNVRDHLSRLRTLVRRHAEFIHEELQAGRPRALIIERYTQWNRRAARDAGMSDLDFPRYVSTNLLEMNVDGMTRYWTRLAEHPG